MARNWKALLFCPSKSILVFSEGKESQWGVKGNEKGEKTRIGAFSTQDPGEILRKDKYHVPERATR